MFNLNSRRSPVSFYRVIRHGDRSRILQETRARIYVYLSSCTIRQLNSGSPRFAYWRLSRAARIPIGFGRTPAAHFQTRVVPAKTRSRVSSSPAHRLSAPSVSRGGLLRTYCRTFAFMTLHTTHPWKCKRQTSKSPYFDR